MRRPGERGQAALELLAAVPAVILAALLGWQLAAVLIAGMRAQEDVRARALAASGRSGTVTVVTARAPVPAVLPGLDGLEMRARIGVRAP